MDVTKSQVQELIKSAKGKVFSGMYVKKDGSLRTFNGKEFLSKELAGGEPNLSDDQVAYFDLNANGWRSFKVDSLVELNINKEKYLFNEK